MTWGAVAGWISGRRKLPAWAAEMIAEHIASRCASGLHLAAELRAYAEALEAAPRQLRGCCAVDESTGRDKRGNWKR